MLASASLDSEAQALLQSGWWRRYNNLNSPHCRWPGITCNSAGSVTRIYPPSDYLQVGDKFSFLNFSAFPNLVYLDLGYHALSGSIPPQIGNLSSLNYLNLSSNYLTDELPSSLGKLTQLKVIDISYNSIEGSIPETLVNLKNLVALNLSGNNLHGYIPSEEPQSSNISTHSLIPCLLYSRVFLRYKAKSNLVTGQTPKNGDLFTIWNYDGKITYEEIITATEDFDIRCCISTGGYGSVYRARLPSGKVVALKKLHRLEAEKPAFDRSSKK
ncbi:hypothetical protein DITRI_Ditri16bG0116200 [Diplodiscus trichospermus]